MVMVHMDVIAIALLLVLQDESVCRAEYWAANPPVVKHNGVHMSWVQWKATCTCILVSLQLLLLMQELMAIENSSSASRHVEIEVLLPNFLTS